MAACLLFLWPHNPVTAQTPPPTERPEVDGRIQYVGPDTYILLDEAGRPQPVLGMTYEEFMAAWKSMESVQSPVAEPRFTIEELRVEGRAHDNHAELEVFVTVRLLSPAAVEIPLGMASGILHEQPNWQALEDGSTREGAQGSSVPGRVSGTETGRRAPGRYIDFVPERGGFVAHLLGQPNDRHRFTLRMLVPLRRDGNETSLPLNLPRALLSKLSLNVPSPVSGVAVSAGSVLSQETNEQGGSRLTVTGLSGDFQLSWRTALSQRPELATVLSATGAIVISIDGHSIRSDAHLTVRSYGGSFDRFQVRLPPGAQLVQDRPAEPKPTSPGYRIVIAGDRSEIRERTALATDTRQIVVVELPERQSGPVQIDLATEQPLGFPGADTAVELAGFEVLGAVRQFGDVALRVADDWQLRWRIGPHVRQVESSELSARLAELNPTAAFQYDRQPWSLRARIVERQFRVHAVPSYVLDLDPGEARLHVDLTYQMPGARAFEFRVQLKGWELTPEPIESDGLVDRNGVLVTRDGWLVLPLVQASSRRAKIGFTVRRDLPPAGGSVELPLPVPEADSLAAADLTVRAAAGMELRPDLSRMRGLSPLPVTNETPLLPNDDGRQAFRYRAFLADSVFAVDRTIRPRAIDANVVTELMIDADKILAQLSVDYWVRNQPLETLTFDVPDRWTLVDDQAEIAPGQTNEPRSGLAALFVAAVEQSGSLPDRESRLIQVKLPQPRLGRFRARLRLTTDWPQPAAAGDRQGPAGPMQLDLPGPSDGDVASTRVSVTSSAELAVTFDPNASGSQWQPIVGPGTRRGASRPSSESSVELIANELTTSLSLVIQRVDPGLPRAASVERVWLQTWRSGSTVQERAAFRFRTTDSAVVVELPPGVPGEDVEVLIDGAWADVATRDEGRLTINLHQLPRSDSEQGLPDRQTIELRYRRPGPASSLARQQLTPPQLVGKSTLADVYWQIVLPGNLHVIRAPDPLVSVSRWQWFNIFWGRQPALSQTELADWVGATSENQSVPSSAHSQYVFSGVAPIASTEIVTAPRWLIVLVASGAVLVVATLWMYVPVVRRGWIGLGMAVLVAGLAVALPVPAMLVGQASIVGWTLALVAVGLRGWLARPASRPALAAGSTQLKLRPPVHSDPMARPVPESSRSSAPVAPISVSEND